MSGSPRALTVYRWELRKLRSQKRTYLGLGAATLVPSAFVIAVAIQGGQAEDVPFGRYITTTGLAIPLVMLLFGSIWFFPLITALVAGDIVASEDQNGTLKTILTRSVERHHVYAGKVLAALTYAVTAILMAGVVATALGLIVSGYNPITSLSGTVVQPGRGLALVAVSHLVYLIPIVAIACIGLLFSTIFRNSAAAIVATLMFSLLLQLVTIIPGPMYHSAPNAYAGFAVRAGADTILEPRFDPEDLLRLMRRVVGPMRAHKTPNRRRD